MAITLTKTDMPLSSDFYTASGTGTETITLNGVTDMILHTKKELTKINKPQTKGRQTTNNSDLFTNDVLDLKKGSDDLNLKGWIEDDESESAWNKYWKLRAMCARGGAITTLVVDNITFNSSTQQAFLEEITGTVVSDDTGEINVVSADGIARIEVNLQFFVGTVR